MAEKTLGIHEKSDDLPRAKCDFCGEEKEGTDVCESCGKTFCRACGNFEAHRCEECYEQQVEDSSADMAEEEELEGIQEEGELAEEEKELL